MGKYKELDVIYNNLDSKEKELINSYNNEFIKVGDKEVPLNIYTLKSKNVICLMESVGTAYLWTRHDFKEETKR